MAEQRLDELVAKFVETKDNHDFAVLMDLMEKSTVLIPAAPPKVLSPEAVAAIKAGQSIPVDKNNQPMVCLMNKNGGGKIFPIFTSREQIPKDKMPPVVMTAPFQAVIAMMMSNKDQVSDIVVNPFTHGVVLNDKLVELADKRFKNMASAASNGPQTVQVTEAQFNTILHTKIAREVLPKMIFADPEGAISKLRVKKEEAILELYKHEYPQGVSCPYTEEDISVMMLQVEEDLLVVRIDMPEANMVVGGPMRIYISYGNDNSVKMFVIEKSSKEVPGNIAEVTASGEYNALMEEPENGAEIETVISLTRPS